MVVSIVSAKKEPSNLLKYLGGYGCDAPENGGFTGRMKGKPGIFGLPEIDPLKITILPFYKKAPLTREEQIRKEIEALRHRDAIKIGIGLKPNPRIVELEKELAGITGRDFYEMCPHCKEKVMENLKKFLETQQQALRDINPLFM